MTTFSIFRVCTSRLQLDAGQHVRSETEHIDGHVLGSDLPRDAASIHTGPSRAMPLASRTCYTRRQGRRGSPPAYSPLS